MATSSTSSITPATLFTPSRNSCFLPSTHKDFNHESGFLNALTTARLLLLPSNLSSGCSSKYATLWLTSWLRCAQLPGPDCRMWIVLLLTMGLQPFRYHAGLHCPVKTAGLVGCLVAVVLWSRCGELPKASPRVGTGVLWALTGTHPCDTSTQAGWWRYQSDSSYERGCVCWCCRAWCNAVLASEKKEKVKEDEKNKGKMKKQKKNWRKKKK